MNDLTYIDSCKTIINELLALCSNTVGEISEEGFAQLVKWLPASPDGLNSKIKSASEKLIIYGHSNTDDKLRIMFDMFDQLAAEISVHKNTQVGSVAASV